MKLKGKVAIITGSSRGIGFGIAEGFVKEGASVVICGSTLESAQKGVDNIKSKFKDADVFPLALNISDTTSIKEGFKQVVEHYGKLDVLVNNAVNNERS